MGDTGLVRIRAIKSRAGSQGSRDVEEKGLDMWVQILYTRFMLRTRMRRASANGTFDLTGIGAGPTPEGLEVAAALDRAGLEMWQAPEGFLAIRAKLASLSTPPSRSERRRARRSR